MENKDESNDKALDEKMSAEKMKDLDTKWIDVILGKTDAVHIKEQFDDIKSADITQQRNLLMNLEEYCWDLDKANALQDWRYLMELLKIVELKDLIYGLFGTIMQNNERAQKLFLNYVVWDDLFADFNQNEIIVNKIMYCLSSVIPSHLPTVEEFKNNNGFSKTLDLLFRDIQNSKIIYFLSKNKADVTLVLTKEHVQTLKRVENGTALLE